MTSSTQPGLIERLGFAPLATADDLDAADEVALTEQPFGHLALCKEGAAHIRRLHAALAAIEAKYGHVSFGELNTLPEWVEARAALVAPRKRQP